MTDGDPDVMFIPACLLAIAIVLGASLVSDGVRPWSGGPAAAVAESFDAALYRPVSDVTFSVADASTGAPLNATVRIYAPDVPERAVFDGSARADYRGTAVVGEVTLTGIRTQTIGCEVDVGVSLANYYEALTRDVWICIERGAHATAPLSVPTIHLSRIGTLSTAYESNEDWTCVLPARDYDAPNGTMPVVWASSAAWCELWDCPRDGPWQRGPPCVRSHDNREVTQ